MNLNHKTDKTNGSQLSASEWNNLAADVNELGSGGANNGTGIVTASDITEQVQGADPKAGVNISTGITGVGTTKVLELTGKGDKGVNITLSGDNNINIEPRAALGTGQGKNKTSDENRKGGNIALKPGDDIELWAHHRGTKKSEKITVKALTESSIEAKEIPADLELNVSNINVTTEDKTQWVKYSVLSDFTGTPDVQYEIGHFSSIPMDTWISSKELADVTGDAGLLIFSNNLNPGQSKVIANVVDGTTIYYEAKKKNDPTNVLNVNVNADGEMGYLKVRAHAIDLRCEDHGGIALQPKGFDSDDNMNKIKFEHGGGDGLEFGTFNTEHTSLFTGDYRFNKNGVIKLATRTTVASDKADLSDSTTAYKYVKAADDFYDNIDANDPTCTWEDIVKYIAWAKANNQGPWAAA